MKKEKMTTWGANFAKRHDEYFYFRGYEKLTNAYPKENGAYTCVMKSGKVKQLIFINDAGLRNVWFDYKEATGDYLILKQDELPQYWKVFYKKSTKPSFYTVGGYANRLP